MEDEVQIVCPICSQSLKDAEVADQHVTMCLARSRADDVVIISSPHQPSSDDIVMLPGPITLRKRPKVIDLDTVEVVDMSAVSVPRKRPRDTIVIHDFTTRPTETPTCNVCLEELTPLDTGYRLCSNWCRVHMPCMSHSVDVSLSDNLAPRCISCGTEAHTHRLLRLLPPEQREKLDAYLLRESLKNLPNMRVCPHAGCGYMVEGEARDDPRITCSECKRDYCFKCKSPWHAALNCEQYQRKLAEDDPDFQAWARRAKSKCRYCPRCSSLIEKNGGCDHMHCSNCKLKFNWSEAKQIMVAPVAKAAKSDDGTCIVM
eukprot:TRINITY_DN7730_c0_g3_i1.p1 TRINITY_DN7730_c0_g3~~TRINITY_DN7730_c0_g3_i1.p1  ORF type:complete len:316 (-),score=24.97 TRINITY_DN7730_c0_g3_i1:289-1236(-)